MRVGTVVLGAVLLFSGAIIDPSGVVAATASPSVDAAAIPSATDQQRGRLPVCHRNGAGAFQLISVSASALPAHSRHGDAQPGEGVPGDPSKQFDALCNPVNVPEPEPPGHNFTGTIGGGPSGAGMCVGEGEGTSFSNFGSCDFEFAAGSDGEFAAKLAWAPDLSPQVMLQMVVTVNGLFAGQGQGNASETVVSVPVAAGDSVRVFFFYLWYFDAQEFPELAFDIEIDVPAGTVRTRPIEPQV